MHWQAVRLDALADKQDFASAPLQVWWWPESLQPEATTRRLRTDAILRTLLARYLPLAPEQLEFGREAKGRPYLQHQGAPDFNLSDTRGGCVLAVAARGRVGIDIERCDRTLPVNRLAERWFSPEEAQALRSVDAERARRAFLRLWTAKEASCKATGTGIYGRLNAWRFAIDGALDAVPTVIEMPDEAGTSARWRFHRLMPASTHTVALACQDNFGEPLGFQIMV